MTLTPRLALLMTLPPLMWAGNAIVGRLMAGQVPPLTLNFLRWAVVVLILLPLAWRVLVPWQRVMQRWRYLLVIGLLSVGLYNALQYAALVTSTPLNVTLVASSTPVWMLAIGALFFGEHPQPRQLLGAALSLSGVAVVIGRGSLDVLLAVQFVIGDLLVVAAAIGWAVYSWMLVRPPAHMQGAARPRADEGWDWAGMLLLQAIFGLVPAALFAAGEQALGAAPVQWGWPVVGALLYISVGASIVAYRAWGLAVAQGGPALAAFFANLTPLFAALLSALVLGEAPRPYHALAFALIVAGIAASTSRAKPGA
ncbi:MAG: DMT family transporter [Rubrivivax sp.]|nr:DMT family transporter [Rubrivivax sp.]